ncbi:protein kinase domain-containing protein [Actinomadura scrupuli]|uniref:protein kinase domain-containing protein n=1 Tax=Actinomadura scrupuli TaxID=559629 RepID=UPI003D96DAAD
MPSLKPLEPHDPTTIGSYRLLGVLGAGGQGTVYLGSGPDGREVAVKLLNSTFARDDHARRLFLREVDAARKVFAYSAQILEVDIERGTPFIVSEYIPGASLLERVTREGPFEESELQRLATGTLTALAAIHAAGIVHCDFKPDNVLLGPDGPRVVDFGIARALETVTPQASRVIGTPAFMAPEQIVRGALGPHTDMFAWGTTMVYAATGVPAFGASGPAAMHRIVNEQPDLTGLPARFHGVIQAALAKNPAERPSAREAMLELLGPSRTRRDNSVPAFALSRPLRSRRLLVSSALAVLLAIAVLVVTQRAGKMTSSSATRMATISTGQGEISAIAVGRLDDRAIAVSGSQGGSARIWDLADRRQIGRTLTGHRGAVRAIAIGRLRGTPVAVTGGDDGVRIWDLRTQNQIGDPLTGQKGAVLSLALTELNGHTVAFAGSYEQVKIWDLQNRRETGPPLTGFGQAIRSLAVGQVNGRAVVVTAGDDQKLRIWDLATRKQTVAPLIGHTAEIRSVAIGDLDGKPIAVSGSLDHEARVWELADDVPVGRNLVGHNDSIWCVAFGKLKDRPIAITASQDRTIRIWDLATRKTIGAPLTGHTGPVDAVAFTQLEGHPVVISGGADRTLMIWDLSNL